MKKTELKYEKQYLYNETTEHPMRGAQKGEAMNVKKAADYSVMYRKLTEILARNLSQMDEIYAIGKAVSHRPEKGAGSCSGRVLTDKSP